MITTVSRLIKELQRYDGKLKVRVWDIKYNPDDDGLYKIKSVGEVPINMKSGMLEPVVTINFELKTKNKSYE